MSDKPAGFQSIDEYMATLPEATRALLEQVRATIRAAAPDAVEKISYQMPTFDLKGNLVHFAAYEHHIGLYPTPNGIEAFKDDLALYQSGKGSVQFPLNEPLPLDLITRIVKYRVEENLKKAAEQAAKKRAAKAK